MRFSLRTWEAVQRKMVPSGITVFAAQYQDDTPLKGGGLVGTGSRGGGSAISDGFKFDPCKEAAGPAVHVA